MGVKIETERLILREFLTEDAEAVLAFSSSDEVNTYTGDKSIHSIEEIRSIITDVWFSDYGTHGYGRWAVIYKPDNKLIGFAGLKYLPELDETDIGYRFLPEYWGKGIASEAAREVLQYGFETLQLKRVIGIAAPENIGSWKVLEKIGLTFYQHESYDGSKKKYNWYQISDDDYFRMCD